MEHGETMTGRAHAFGRCVTAYAGVTSASAEPRRNLELAGYFFIAHLREMHMPRHPLRIRFAEGGVLLKTRVGSLE